MVVPSLVGGIAGAMLLRWTPTATFDRLVPFLILFATLLFMAQEPVQRKLRHGRCAPPSTRWLVGGMLFQLMVGLYGGYFGAGIGILMLAALSILGLKDIHEMNSLKVVFGGTVNGIAAAYSSGPADGVLAVRGADGGGSDCGRLRGCRHRPQAGTKTVRRIVVAIGFGAALSLFIGK